MLYLVKTIEDELKDHELWLKSNGQRGKRADFSGRTLSGVVFTGKNLRGALFINSVLKGCRFVGTDLTGAWFSRAVITGCTFRCAKLHWANFEKSQIMESDFSESWLNRAVFNKAAVSYSSFWETVVDKATRFTGAKFNGINLNGLLRLSDPDFSGARLTECIVANAPGSKQKNCKSYTDARYVTAQHGGCAITGFNELIDVHEMFLKNGEEFDLDFSQTVLQGLDLQGKDLRGIKFRNACLKGVNLANARTEGCDFSGAVFEDVITLSFATER